VPATPLRRPAAFPRKRGTARRAPSSFLVLLVFLLLPAQVLAQASLTGTVRDASGAVLSGVTVEAESTALIEKVRTAVSDGTGSTASSTCAPAPIP
jgi:hypothetical protein